MNHKINLIMTFISFSLSSSAFAEDMDHEPDRKTSVQTTAGFVFAQSQNENPNSSTRIRIRGSSVGIPLSFFLSEPSEYDMSVAVENLSFLRTNAFGEWDYRDSNLQAYNIDTDLISFNGFGMGAGGIMDFRGAIGYLQLSHDELMEEQYDLSAKLIDCEVRLIDDKGEIVGLGLNLLGYQQRRYKDDTIMKGFDLVGVRLEYGKLWMESFIPIEITVSTDGDIGIAEGFIFDNLIDTRLSFHLPIFGRMLSTPKKPSARLQFLATHNLHYNSARESATQGVLRFAGQFTLHYPMGL